MRKFMLALAGAAMVLGAGMLTTPSGATTLAGPAGLHSAVVQGGTVHKARFACTHFWNGRYHRRAVCAGYPGYRHYGFYRYGAYRAYGAYRHPGYWHHRHWR